MNYAIMGSDEEAAKKAVAAQRELFRKALLDGKIHEMAEEAWEENEPTDAHPLDIFKLEGDFASVALDSDLPTTTARILTAGGLLWRIVEEHDRKRDSNPRSEDTGKKGNKKPPQSFDPS